MKLRICKKLEVDYNTGTAVARFWVQRKYYWYWFFPTWRNVGTKFGQENHYSNEPLYFVTLAAAEAFVEGVKKYVEAEDAVEIHGHKVISVK